MKKTRVMIIDDEKDFVTVTKLNLEMTGKYEVIPLLSAEGIVSKVKKHRPDIILLDILMPKISGTKACRILKKDPQTSAIPIVSISALDTDKDKLMMRQLGASGFLAKPVEKDIIIAKIEEVLNSCG